MRGQGRAGSPGREDLGPRDWQGKQAVQLGIGASIFCRLGPHSWCWEAVWSKTGGRLAGLPGIALSSPTRVFGSQNLTTVKLKGVGESFKKYPDYESKGIKAHFNLDESGVLSLIRVRAE